MKIIQCPNCNSILLFKSNCLRCENGHSFDIAKEGYTNLVLAHQKKKLNSGDNLSMIKNREAFLSSGHYDFLIEKIESIISTESSIDKNVTQIKTVLLDLGCGSGYYTRSLLNQSSDINKVGIDVSKAGISISAKKDKTSIYLVASIFNIPLVDNSVDVVTNIFAPCDINEIRRVLRDGGLFIKVIPHYNHMKEIAELVYENFKPHTSDVEEQIKETENLSLINSHEVIQKVNLKSTDIQNLISMTPYVYKFQEEQLNSLQDMSVTFSFKIILGKIKKD